jgi:hypothetical protein
MLKLLQNEKGRLPGHPPLLKNGIPNILYSNLINQEG